MKRILKSFFAAFALAAFAGLARADNVQLLNVSYDPTRELYQEINPAFAKWYQAKTGNTAKVDQSHAGSSKQARAVIDGLKADIVTLALGFDIKAIEKAGLINAGWEKRAFNATPYASTIVFVVRKQNPKGIKDWNDLVRDGISVITPNPKTSGGARWAFVAAWGYGAGLKAADIYDDTRPAVPAEQVDALYKNEKARDFIAKLYHNVPVLDTGARGSTVTFAQKDVGDVLIAWENEAYLLLEEFGEDKFEIVKPSVSVLAEPQVAIVDAVVDEHHTRDAAEAYLAYLYTPEAQEIIAGLHYRPRDKEVAKAHLKDLPGLPVFNIDAFGGWEKAQAAFFGDGGAFDQIYKPGR